jgi:hypothetical protein
MEASPEAQRNKTDSTLMLVNGYLHANPSWRFSSFEMERGEGMSEAVFGLIGVLIGVFSTWGQSWWSERRSTGRAAHYLAVRVVCVLDQYVERCAEVVSDDGLSFGQRNPDGCLEPQVPLPGPPMFPEDVDWKSISHDLMYRLLSMSADVEGADKGIAFVWNAIACPPDYDEFFEERSYQYGRI